MLQWSDDLLRAPRRGVQDSAELQRIKALPRRVWSPEQADDLVKRLTAAHRAPGGTMTLLPLQAIALAEMAMYRGAHVGIPVGGGKAQPNMEPVLLERGWTPIGDVTPGDRIYGSDGALHDVLAVWPQGQREVWRVTFADRTFALCDPDHLWTFCPADQRVKPQTRTARAWAALDLSRPCGEHRASKYFLPEGAAIQRPEVALPLDPYTLGALLGDGSMVQGCPSFTSMDVDIVAGLALPPGIEVRATSSKNSGKATQYNLTTGPRGRLGRRNWNSNGLTRILRDLGCWGHKAQTKSIPAIYMCGSVDQRLALLQGLMDTDGEQVRAAAGFSSTSAVLIEQVAEIVESLGGSATRIERHNHWRLSVRLPRGLCPFRCARKREPWTEAQKGRQRAARRAVVSIDPEGYEAPSTCLSVSAPDHLYVTRFHVLTHNTLIQFLSARMFRHVKRPLYLMPAHLISDKVIEEREYRKHWTLPAFRTLESYQALSRVSKADLLHRLEPDLIVCDEAHYLKNLGAGVTKRVFRYLRERPDCILVSLTGTPFGISLRDFAHQAQRSLGAGSPIPGTHIDLDEWCRALDADTPEQKALDFGELTQLDPTDPDPLHAFQRRLIETPGVVLSQDPPLPVPIHFESHVAPMCSTMADAMAVLRKDWITPDGIMCRDGIEVWRHAREISTGFFSVWTPRAPGDWRDARSAWAKECRHILAHNRRDIDTEEQLIRHLANAPEDYPEAVALLKAWREIEPSFTPNPVPTWISDDVIDWIVRWSQRKGKPGLIWTDRPAVGQRLAARGLAYYGEEGIDQKTGRRTMEHDPAVDGSCVLGRRSNDSGRNLQAWNRNLVIDIPSRGTDWEQMIGRTHRRGQRAERIDVDLLFGCIEDVAAFWKARGRAQRAQDITGQPQKLCLSDLSCVTDADALDQMEPRWRRTK